MLTRRKDVRWSVLLLVALALGVISAGPVWARAPAPSGASAKEPSVNQTYQVEYYYKTHWGHADEWLALFQKNHLPFLQTLKKQGRILDIEIERPRYHMTEDARWDFRVTITWKNIAASVDSAGEPALIQKLFPDQDTFKREEQRRWDIILAHWDLPVVEVALEP